MLPQVTTLADLPRDKQERYLAGAIAEERALAALRQRQRKVHDRGGLALLERRARHDEHLARPLHAGELDVGPQGAVRLGDRRLRVEVRDQQRVAQQRLRVHLRERRAALSREAVIQILKDGAEVARAKAQAKMKLVREKVGVALY